MWSTQVHCRNISIGGVLVPLELKSKEPDGDRIVYTGTYETEGVAPTKSGERQPIQITMPVRPTWVLDCGAKASGNHGKENMKHYFNSWFHIRIYLFIMSKYN